VRVPEFSELRIDVHLHGAGSWCRSLLEQLPTWFGVPASVEDYVATADRHPTLVASLGREIVGILTVVKHFPYTAEIFVMAVLPEHHRQGVGRALLRDAENVLANEGVEYLQVKTLSASKPDVGYEKTRAFYLACGFRALEEFPTLWGSDNPALVMVKAITSKTAPD
jgi:ribosomal protein S18 acetylase RimI-like enzyme